MTRFSWQILYCNDPASNSWSEHEISFEGSTVPLVGAAAAISGKNVWLFGGMHLKQGRWMPHSGVVVFDTTDHTFKSSQSKFPMPTSHAAAVTLNDNAIMILGGYVMPDTNSTNIIPSNYTAMFQPNSNAFVDAKPLTSPMAPCSAVKIHAIRTGSSANSTFIIATGGSGPPVQFKID